MTSQKNQFGAVIICYIFFYFDSVGITRGLGILVGQGYSYNKVYPYAVYLWLARTCGLGILEGFDTTQTAIAIT